MLTKREEKMETKSEDVGQKRQQNNRASANNVACNGKLRQQRTDRIGVQCLNKIMRCGVVIRKKQKIEWLGERPRELERRNF